LRVIKFDGHIHSRFSDKPITFILSSYKVPESFTEPEFIYTTARKRGMDLVTITDHDEIRGCLDLLDKGYEAVFVSEEATVYFPDGASFDLLLYNIDDEQHLMVQKLKKNAFDVAHYVREQDIAHSVAHPFRNESKKLTKDHIEKLFLMFQGFESMPCDSRSNISNFKKTLETMTDEHLEMLAEKHGVMNPNLKADRFYTTGGSDDHAGLFIAKRWTEALVDSGTNSIDDLFKKRRFKGAGKATTAEEIAMTSIKITGDFYNMDGRIDRAARMIPGLSRVMRVLTLEKPKKRFSIWQVAARILKYPRYPEGNIRRYLIDAMREMPDFGKDSDYNNAGENFTKTVNYFYSSVIRELAGDLESSLKKGNLIALGDFIGTALTSSALFLAPYAIAQKIRHYEKSFGRKVSGTETRPRIAHVTGTFDENNGVAGTMREWAGFGAEDIDVITCKDTPSSLNEIVLEPLVIYRPDLYMGLPLPVPSIIDVFNLVYAKNYSHINIATPGFVGASFLAAAKLFGIKTICTHHTDTPKYLGRFTGEDYVEHLAWRYHDMFYRQCDILCVNSEASAELLRQKGIDHPDMRIIPRGIPVEMYKRVRGGWSLNGRHNTVIVAGRMSHDKNFDQAIIAFRKMNHPDAKMLMVGDGPAKGYLESLAEGANIRFTGYLTGRDLVDAYGRAGLGVFSSENDTFGRVVLEAQAAGIPVIVTDKGGPKEFIRPGETGFIVPANNIDALARAMECYIGNIPLLRDMGNKAAAYADLFDARKKFNEMNELLYR